MRHKIAHRKLNRTSEHRKALFKNMLNSLIKYEQITTTLPKAKELKPQMDKVITLGKKNNLQSKKNLFGSLQSKDSVDKLSKVLSTRYQKRNGGYCRIIRAGFRYGDDAPMAVIELVDRDPKAKKVDIKPKDKDKETKKTETPLKAKEIKKK
ncbi:50S ribosomal protein L17 [Pelagibacteraceae bacterium]|jgi:large subunit ribosomal protein L17|nr:50S ribosomal protein L17 [Pelagibacteraceae bacterium]